MVGIALILLLQSAVNIRFTFAVWSLQCLPGWLCLRQKWKITELPFMVLGATVFQKGALESVIAIDLRKMRTRLVFIHQRPWLLRVRLSHVC